jgi:TonB family protein
MAEQGTKLKQAAHWPWQEPYFAAMREQNPFSLPQRLVTAEKAILLRIEVLRDAPESLPELKALREALNSLYAREPKRTAALPQVVHDQEEYEARQANRAKLISWVALATILSFSTGWIVATKNTHNDIQSGANNSERKGNVTNSDMSYANPREVHILNTPPEELRSLPQELAVKPLPPSNQASGDRGPKAETGSGEDLVGDARPSDHGPLGPPASGNIVKAGPSDATAKNPLSRSPEKPSPALRQDHPAFPLSLDQPKPAPEVRAEPQSGLPPAVMGQQPGAAVDAMSKLPEPQPIPQGSVTVSLSGYPSIRVPAELRPQTVGAKLQIGEVISRVNPTYPEDAEREHIEGVVKLHAIIGTDGAVRDAQAVSGPPQLADAAVRAVRQWRYLPTLLGGQPIETGQDFNIVFRLKNEPTSAN